MNTPHLRTTLAILTLLCLPAAATFAPAGFLSPTRSGPPRAGTPRLSQLAAPPAGPYTCIPVSVPPSRPATQAPSPAVTPAPYGQLPLQFESNQGQTDSHVRFLSRGRGYTLFLTGNEAVLSLRNAECRMQNAECRPLLGGAPVAERPANRKSKIENPKSAVVRMQLLGGNSGAPIQGLTPLPGKVNYLTGRGPRKWRTNIRTYAKVRCRGVYPGIDLVYYGQQQQLEYDFVVAPGADPGRIGLAFAGADDLGVDAGGDLVVRLAGGDVRFRKPHVYQESGGRRTEVASAWTLGNEGFRDQDSGTRNTQHATRTMPASADRKSKTENRKSATFRLARYDRARPLVIDPVLDYATYLGAGGSEAAKAIAVDSAGCAYIAGSTDGDSLPVTAGAVQPARAALTDVFVAKLDATGGNLVYCTYLGGTQHESPGGIAVDAYGRASVAGYTASTDFPTTAGAFQVHQSGGDGSAFVIRLDATGTRFLYSTYLGGSGHDAASAIALDSLGCAFVTGHTLSADFPVTRRPAPRGRGYDVFLTRLNASGSAIAYSTCLGGSEAEFDSVIALGPGGSVFLAGSTESPDFPTTRGAFQPDTTPQAAPQLDGFLVRVNASGASLDYATRLGGTYNDQIAAVDVDAAGCAYVAGRTASLDFPTTPGALKQGPTEGEDAFVAKVSAGGTSLLYATCLGGANSDVGQGIAVDASGCASAVGTTSSPDFPTTPGSPQPGPASQDRNTSDFFVTRVNSGGTGLIYSTYVGGGNHEWGGAIALGNDGSAFVTGHSESLDFPTTTGAFQATWHGASDAVILRLNPAGTGLLYSTYLGGQGGEERGNGIAVDAAGSAYIVGSTESVQFPITGGCLQPERGASQDAFVSKLSPAGDRLVYSTYLGGSGLDSAAGVVVDSAGNACVGGTTRSPDFPITAGALQSSLGGTSDAFVSRLDASGSSLLSSTYLGGSGEDGGNSLAHDASGCLYLAGSTGSHDFPVTATAAQAQNRGPIYAPFDAFIAKLSPPASSLIYATYLGGSSNEGADGIAVDAAGCAYVTGGTWSLDFPVTPGAWYRERRAYTQQRAFVAKANAAGTQFLCATCLGASGWTVGTAIAVDSAGCAYMTGVTNSADFPTTPGAIEQSRTSAPQGADAFVTKLNSVGSSLVYSTYLGRRGFGSGSAIAVDALGCACLAGTAYQWYTQPCLAKLNSSGTALIQSVFLQGTGWPYGLALDREGRALLTGEATWDGFQCTSGVPQATYAGAGDVFVARLVLSVGVLHFSRQPADASAGTSLPPVQVSVTDASGRAPVVPVPVTLAIASGTGPSGAVLKGATVARSAGGAATFRSLYLSTMGEGYRLIATAPGCAPVTSAPFAVSAGAPYRLAFTVQPANAPANASIQPAVQVAVQDRYGNPCSGATAAVTLSLARSPAGSTLSGTVTCVPVLGLATFTDLQLDTRGVYVLKADCGALQMAQSKAFTVLMPSTVP